MNFRLFSKEENKIRKKKYFLLIHKRWKQDKIY